MTDKKVVIALGPTQHGKSATCNMLSGKMLAPVCDGTGESTTAEPNVYEFVPAGADFELVYVDIPGLFDTREEISNKSVKSAIGALVDASGVSSVSAVVLFESLAESGVSLYSTIQFAQSVFGSSVTDSAFVLTTKADLPNAEEKKLRMQVIAHYCNQFNLRYCEWTNEGSESEKSTAIASFLSMVKETKALDLGERTAMRDAIEKEAKQMQEAETETVRVNYEEDEKYNEPGVRAETELYLAPMYSSEAEIAAKASEVQKLLPQDYTYYRDEMYPHQYYVQTGHRETEYILGFIPHHYTVHRSELRTETRCRKVPYSGPRPIEDVKAYIRNQTVQKTRTKEVKVINERVRRVTRQREERVPKFGIEHYRKVAAKKLLKQMWTAAQK